MAAVEADRGVPALLMKIGRYPLHSGGVGVIRTLGRLGVPVYATTEDPFTPAALSRYCAGRFKWRTSGLEEPGTLVRKLMKIAERIGRRSVIIPVDDESATLVSERRDQLARYFLIPPVPPGLPRQVASKHELYRLCCEHGVPAPASVHVSGIEEAVAFAKQATFPVVVKNSEPWVRMRAPVVTGTTVVRESSELLALVRTPAPELSLLLQEYIPPADAEDWIVHLYSGPDHGCLVVFTGLKIRSWPPNAGQTACAYSVRNPALARIATRFCNQIGFRGIADLDWRLDRRDGRYKLVDFNPRVGNQFRLFETDTGVDVVRALHLDLTGRSVPTGEQVYGRRFLLEHADPLARLADRRSTRSRHLPRPQPGATELAWAARDDPLPFAAMWPRLAMPLASYLVHMHRPGSRWRELPGISHGACRMARTGSTRAVVIIEAGPRGLPAAAHPPTGGWWLRCISEGG
jgi:D-aspartate ligase